MSSLPEAKMEEPDVGDLESRISKLEKAVVEKHTQDTSITESLSTLAGTQTKIFKMIDQIVISGGGGGGGDPGGGEVGSLDEVGSLRKQLLAKDSRILELETEIAHMKLAQQSEVKEYMAKVSKDVDKVKEMLQERVPSDDGSVVELRRLLNEKNEALAQKQSEIFAANDELRLAQEEISALKKKLGRDAGQRSLSVASSRSDGSKKGAQLVVVRPQEALGSSQGTRLGVSEKKLNEALYEAADEGWLDDVKDALERGANINYQGLWLNTPLMRASLNGHLLVVLHLLTQGAKTDLRDRNGWTAMHCAAMKKNREIVEALMKAGADKDPKS